MGEAWLRVVRVEPLTPLIRAVFQLNKYHCRRKAATESKLMLDFLPLHFFGEDISACTAAGGQHAKREHHTKESQETLRHLAISLVGENVGREEDL